MNFKTKRIRFKRCSLKSPHTFKIGLIIGSLLAIIVLFSAYAGIKSINIHTILKSLPGKKLQTDIYNHTNFLLLGIGNDDHEGTYLTDSIMVVSVDHITNHVAMLSLPRDLYVINEFGQLRINQIYETGVKKEMPEKGMDVLIESVEKITATDIHYFIKINFKGFEQIIDAIGGVDIIIDQTIIDKNYPKGETYEYETFTLEKGLQHLDGETALKYVRTRKCNICYDGDFGRAKRQQNLLSAAKEKILNTKTLLSPTKIKKIFVSIQENFESNLKLGELFYIAKIAEKFKQENIISWVVNDDPSQTGGFLYVPERAYYNGAFVLIPTTNPMGIKDENPYYEINDFARLVLQNPAIMKEATTIEIQNGTKYPNLAALTLIYLKRYGFNAVNIDNAEEKNHEITTVQWNVLEKPPIVDLLSKIMPVGTITKNEKINGTIYDITIIVGEDMYNYYQKEKARFY